MGAGLELIEGFYKAYVVKAVAKDMARIAQKAWSRRSDTDYFLHRVGLRRRQPVKSGLGLFSMFCLGAVGGGAAALLLAPESGEKTRRQLGAKTKELLGTAKKALPQISARA
jgi:hypothetical protein